MSTTTPTQIRIDTNLKQQASVLFASLGTDMSSAVNIFLRQCVLKGGIPFEVKLPEYSHETSLAIEEARALAYDESVKGFTNMAEYHQAMAQGE